jgi:hypothetical protein
MKKDEIVGVSQPIPTEFAERIYKSGKTVFVSKRCLGQVSPGAKFIIYESHGAKAYTGWADIKFIGKMKINSIIRNYGKKLMLSSNELREYAKGNNEMGVIEFENFEKFKNPVYPKRFVTVAGKYIYEDEFEKIKLKKE